MYIFIHMHLYMYTCMYTHVYKYIHTDFLSDTSGALDIMLLLCLVAILALLARTDVYSRVNKSLFSYAESVSFSWVCFHI